LRVTATTDPAADTGADTIAVGVFADEEVAHDVEGGALQALLDAGEARSKARHLAVTHAAGKRWILVGLGSRAEFDHERARAAAGVVEARARELGARNLCWEVPHGIDTYEAAALVEGTVLGAYRFDRYRSAEPDGGLESLVLSAHEELDSAAERAVVVAEAQNAARDLQNVPANDMTPTILAERAQALAGEVEGLEVEIEGRAEIEARGMGAFAAVARGSHEEPALITLRYEGAGAEGPVLGFVGKAVTFDSGGISIKPSAKMQEMKFDMSGGAAVLEAVGAIARLGLPVRVVAVVGATENLPSGHAMKPGDIVRAMNGTTIEINNTDAEGRLVLADCLAHAVNAGAQRLVDVATLTGGVIVALGSTLAGLMSTDDAWAAEVESAATRAGERVWRLPLDPGYDDLIKGQYADITNAPDERKASSIVGGMFLKRFVGEVPWAHLDIAGTAWNLGHPYAAKGGSGFGVRLLVELAAGAARA
jgi:leucyl aminopeptidase